MLTIFTIPKAFRGHFAIIQENAIASWTKIRPRCEIILFGNDKGVQHITKNYGAKHIADVKKNEKGTPILSDIFNKAQRASRNKILCYVNADVILPPDFCKVIDQVSFNKFLISGQRLNLGVGKLINFNGNWQNTLKIMAKKRGKLDQMGALDYFIFPKNINFKMPPFAIGRGAWDNWLIYKAKLLKIPVVDATEVIAAIHQKHDYSHAGGYHSVWYGEERRENLELAKEKKKPFNLVNADYLLTENGLRKPEFSLYRYWRVLQVDPIINPARSFITWPLVLPTEILIKIYKKISKI